MSDLPTDLIDRLMETDATRIYLPTNPKDTVNAQKTEARCVDPGTAAVADAYFSSPDRLHGDKVPNLTTLKETPMHRMMVYMHAAGKTAREIADQTNYSYSSVSQVLRQPWARERVVQILKETGGDMVRHFLNSEVSPSLEVIRDIRDDPKAKPADRITAAKDLIDRALGKATIMVESKSEVKNIPSDAARLDAEIAAVRKQLSSKGFSDGPN